MLSVAGKGATVNARSQSGKNAAKPKPKPNAKATSTPQPKPRQPQRLTAVEPKRDNAARKLTQAVPKKNVVTATDVGPPSAAAPNIVELASQLLADEPSTEDIGRGPGVGVGRGTGSVRIRFNHKNAVFPVHNGVLRWADVDAEYCFSFVYRGNYRRDVLLVDNTSGEVLMTSACPSTPPPPGSAPTECTQMADWPEIAPTCLQRDELGLFFVGFEAQAPQTQGSGLRAPSGPGFHYRVDVEEDAVAGIGAEGLAIRSGPITRSVESFAGAAGAAGVGGKGAVNRITAQLRGMAVGDLHSAEAQALREQRDIEDVLFSGPGDCGSDA